MEYVKDNNGRLLKIEIVPHFCTDGEITANGHRICCRSTNGFNVQEVLGKEKLKVLMLDKTRGLKTLEEYMLENRETSCSLKRFS